MALFGGGRRAPTESLQIIAMSRYNPPITLEMSSRRPNANGVRTCASQVVRSMSLIVKIPKYFTICVEPAKNETMTSETKRSVSVIVCRLMLIDKSQATAAEISFFQNSYSAFHCSIASSADLVLSLGSRLVTALSFSAKLLASESLIDRSFFNLIWISLNRNLIVFI